MKIGFIGSGNMGEAIIKGMIESKEYNSEDILVSGRNSKTLNKLKDNYLVNVASDNKGVASQVDILIIAVKPNVYLDVVSEVKDSLNKNTILVNIAAGINIIDIENILGENKKIIRVMPNTPAMVNEGMSVIFPNNVVDSDDINKVKNIFDSIGKTEILDESQIHGVIGISGSSPAYVYMFIEALADAGVKEGLKRDVAYRLASQAVLGSAKMILETNMHPGVLKDNVCSPGGTTIEAVVELEENGFKGNVTRAVECCISKSKNM